VVSDRDTMEINNPLNLLFTPAITNDEPKFILFSKLPLELRQQIWLAAAIQSDPQIIKISYSAVPDRIPFFKIEFGSCKVLPLLHTSYEARETVTKVNKIYKFSWESELYSTSIYINFAKDILFFNDTKALLVFCGYNEPFIGDAVLGGLANLPKTRNIFEKELRHLVVRCGIASGDAMVGISRFQKLEEVILEHSWHRSILPGVREFDQQTWIAALEERWIRDAKDRGVAVETHTDVKLLDPEAFREKFPVSL
jgi:hypothetical protein